MKTIRGELKIIKYYFLWALIALVRTLPLPLANMCISVYIPITFKKKELKFQLRL